LSPRLSFSAALFDLDGVVTRTATLHAAAWKRLFDTYLASRPSAAGERHEPFDLERDYLDYVDGKPRYDGVRSFLSSRGIALPEGSATDEPGTHTVCALGNLKDGYFGRALEHGVEVFDSTVSLIRGLRTLGTRTALVSSSKHAGDVVARAGLASLFDVQLDGHAALALGLAGKPRPDLFRAAAERLGVDPGQALVVEDALAGVQAGRAGGFGLVVGVDRHHDRQALLDGGAHVVVSDLGELGIEALDTAFPGIPPLALDALADLERRIASRRIVLFLDYDGTLTPIVQRPEFAVLSDAMRATLERLARRVPTAIVSGRALDDVRALVGLESLYYAGNHGFEIQLPGRSDRQERGGDHLDAVQEAAGDLAQRLAAIDGAFVENKRYSLSVHYRLTPPDRVPEVERHVDEVVARYPTLRKHLGKKVYEVRPAIAWDKGRAVLWLLETLDLDGPDVMPIYLGDDVTDEDAFAVLVPRGIGVLVTAEPRPTAATYRLQDTDEVRAFLDRLGARTPDLRSRPDPGPPTTAPRP
jgi:alpha,alpha-trehalase